MLCEGVWAARANGNCGELVRRLVSPRGSDNIPRRPPVSDTKDTDHVVAKMHTILRAQHK